MKVLLAEDSDVVRQLLHSATVRAGHVVTSVADGLAAWETFRTLSPEIVILDWSIPGIDGLEVCRRIRAHPASEQTFVLMVTARDSGDELSAALAGGVDDYITKPVTPGHLRARLQIAQQGLRQRAARREAEEALSHSRWLAGIGETTLALQHELNNPLFALLGHAELFAADPNATERQLADIEVIVEQARRVAAVVRRLALLKEPRSVPYIADALMLDLSGEVPAAKVEVVERCP